MELCVVGTGYVGLVVGACLADFGHRVICVDKDPRKLHILRSGGLPIFEPGLEEVVKRNHADGRLDFSSDLARTVATSEVTFIAVGTPTGTDGRPDLSAVLGVADEIGRSMVGPMTVVIKSTVPVGTSDRVRATIEGLTKLPFDVVSNPEFLAEGTALDDFCKPDRIVVGYRNPESAKVMDHLYAPLVRTGRPILHMDNRSAEMAKYAANAMLATRITFMNEVANLCEAVGADVEMVRRAVGADQRIGARFLFPGCGYGGSCFPKDVRALLDTARIHDTPSQVGQAVHEVNERQKHRLIEKVIAALGDDLRGKRFAVWGLAFKSRTDDVRESPALVFIEDAIARGATIIAHDPEAMDACRREIGDKVTYAEDPMSAVDGVDAVVIPTDWNAFRSPDLHELRTRMRGRLIVDGRNLYEPDEMAAAGFDYRCIGRPWHAPVDSPVAGQG